MDHLKEESILNYLSGKGISTQAIKNLKKSFINPTEIIYDPSTIAELRKLHVKTMGYSTDHCCGYRNCAIARYNLDSWHETVQEHTELKGKSKTVSFHLDELNSNGYTVIPKLFDQECIKEIRNTLLRDKKYISDYPNLPEETGMNIINGGHGSIDTREIRECSSRYFTNHENDIIDRIRKQPLILEIVRRYLGGAVCTEPSSTMLTIPGTANKDSEKQKTNDIRARVSSAQYFHFDYDHIKWLKVFINWTDIGTENGPHEFIKGSHRKLNMQYDPRSLSHESQQAFDREIQLKYSESITRFLVPAGSVLIEDTGGWHRGTP